MIWGGSMNIEKMIEEMTLEEKATLMAGYGFWETQKIERVGLNEAIWVSDGPNGLRMQPVDENGEPIWGNGSIDAVTFPSACATTASFDRELMHELGSTLGKECQAEKCHVLLGPAMNMKRSPLCGRNFEYMSEDPYLAGEMAVPYIKGVQEEGVGTSIKHFAANNQEHERMYESNEVDERTLREIYLPAFEKAVKEAAEFEAQDKRRKEAIDAKNDADSMVFQTEQAMNEVGDKLDAAQKETVQTDLNKLKAILERTKDDAEISDADLDLSLNLVRQRSNPDMVKLSNSLVSANGLSMREEIRAERTVELALEGFRVDDLKRWKTAETEMPQNLRGIPMTGWFATNWTNQTRPLDADGSIILYDGRVWAEKNYLYPIPSDELQLNPELGQNKGWN